MELYHQVIGIVPEEVHFRLFLKIFIFFVVMILNILM